MATFYKMKKILFIFTFISLNTFAENSRAPAVLDTSCNLDVASSITVMIDGKKVVKEKSVEVFQKELCKAVRDCMGSAPDEMMEELRGREIAACSNSIKAITTKVPAVKSETSFDGKRNAKPDTMDSKPINDSIGAGTIKK